MTIGDEILVKVDERRRYLWTLSGFGICRSCQEEIYWVTTHTGRKAPVNIPPGDGQATTSHFSTCEQGDQWRSGK